MTFVSVKGKSDEQLSTELNWLEVEKLWLVHRLGFTAVRMICRNQGTNKLKVLVEETQEEFEVEDDDVEKVKKYFNFSIKLFLCNLTFCCYTEIGQNQLSHPVCLNYEIPQISILGPALFVNVLNMII